ncbi:ThiF family adenylyltransferase [Pedobacter sp. MW01-1-1]|uniref:ThiF family adenylyltransferase n=1 Tax=Pedobacter sp. MW01-1-1 TaxID=3383027 RepID=UPI003FEF91DF
MNVDQERYSKQLLLDGFGEAKQRQLAQAKVLVIGAGGLGCPALQYLVAAGIGTIGIIDHDTVSLSNLHRQILYSTADIGQLKVEVAKQKLHNLNPDVQITTYPFQLKQHNCLEILTAYDYIFDGSDNFATRYLVNDACVLLQKPFVFAAIATYEGQLAVFNLPNKDGKTCNYRDVFPVQPQAGEILNCALNGVLGVLPGIIGVMAATELIKIITQIGTSLSHKFLHYNLLTNEQLILNIHPQQNYPMPKSETEFLATAYEENCERMQEYTEIDIQTFQKLLENPACLVIDVRELHEHPKLKDTRIVQKPMSSFETTLAQQFDEEHLVFICQHGIRSVAAAEYFYEKHGRNKKIYSLKGGISKWKAHF